LAIRIALQFRAIALASAALGGSGPLALRDYPLLWEYASGG